MLLQFLQAPMWRSHGNREHVKLQQNSTFVLRFRQKTIGQWDKISLRRRHSTTETSPNFCLRCSVHRSTAHANHMQTLCLFKGNVLGKQICKKPDWL